MPIIKITDADIQRQRTLEENWYGVEIVKISDFVTSSKGDSANVIFTFLIEDTNGKEIDRYYNTKAIGMTIPLYEAITGKSAIKAFEFNTDDFLHKKADNKIKVETFEGRLNNKISDNWLPYGKGKDQKAPF